MKKNAEFKVTKNNYKKLSTYIIIKESLVSVETVEYQLDKYYIMVKIIIEHPFTAAFSYKFPFGF